MILDGWGISKNDSASAIYHAHTPFVDSCYKKYPNVLIRASALDVGLPEGQMGNSEVGHMNLGAGRVVYQNLFRINKAIEDGSFIKNDSLCQAFNYAKINEKKIHFIGLLSDGGVHSHMQHLFELLKAARANDLKGIFVHAFTDGRDTDPMAGKIYLKQLLKELEKSKAKLATVIGRYYAMDRDQRWSRVKKAYDVMVKGKGDKSTNIIESIENSYSKGITDEFIEPIVMTDNKGKAIAKIASEDVVICFNFRTDRARQITQVLTQRDFPKENMSKLNLRYTTMTSYDQSFKNIQVLFQEQDLRDTLGEVLEKHFKKQIRIAETEKYPHVTFFFSGGREKPFDGEKRILCPSPKVATYDLQPEMNAIELRDKTILELNKKEADFICLNFANPDMVGHTGVMRAAVKACETVDICAKEVCEAAILNDYAVIMLADHGNAEYMINPDGTPNTAHTTNEVPCFFIHKTARPKLNNGKLGDIAPTILQWMELPQPELMTGVSLFSKK